MILKYNFKDLNYDTQLTEYQQTVLDIAAYNSALLKLDSPTHAGVTGENGKKADQCYQAIIQNAQDWMQSISVHCRVIPETIASYDALFQGEIETIRQGLKVLINTPDDSATKTAVAAVLNSMNEIMSSYTTDINDLINEITDYKKGNETAVGNFQTIVSDIIQEIHADKEQVKKIRTIIQDAQKKLEEASQRLENDEKLLNKTFFIVVSIFTFGIPLIVCELDAAKAKKQIEVQKLLIREETAELEKVSQTIVSLTAAQTAYTMLQEQTVSLLSSSRIILDIWNKMSETAGDFAAFLQEESGHMGSSDYRNALSEINDMEKSWKSLSQFSSKLSKVHYEIIVEKDAAA